MVSFGWWMLFVAFGAALVSIGALIWGQMLGEKNGRGSTNVGYQGTFVAMAALTVATLLIVFAFFTLNFHFQYVAENHSTDVSSLAWLYKLSGLWAGREGSFLLWAWLLSLFASFVAWRRFSVKDQLSNMGLMVTNVVLVLFTAGMMFSDANNPFKTTPDGFIDPATGKLLGEAASWGMNPLLQHWAMILHPPTLFIGYAGLTIPFAFAIAALIVNDGSSRWVEMVDRITVFSWLFLGLGIGLGAIWAYVVLGWGGYWAWDPVENASLLPWLTGVALLHSFTVYRRRDGFKRWSVMLAAFTFALVILGTFITRSGIVDSVHAFAPDTLSLWLFLGMIVGSLVIAGAGLGLRWETFAGNDEFESLTSKESAYYFNNVIMLVAGILVAYLTITSGLPKLALGWLPLAGKSIPATTFDAVARPVGILYLLILAVCPLLSWRNTDGATFWKRVKWPLVGGLVLTALLWTEFFTSLKPIYDRMIVLATTGSDAGTKMLHAGPAWYYEGMALVGLAIASLLISTQLSLFIDGALKRSRAKEENFFASLWSILTKARSQSGGYLAHIGMGIILIGLIGSAMFVYDNTYQVPDKSGSSFTVDRYTFVYTGADQKTLSNGDVEAKVFFTVQRDGKSIGVITPGMTTFTSQGKDRLDAKVLSEPLRDVFVVFQGGGGGQDLTVNVKINPLIWFSWTGFIILLLGTALAAWPKAGPRELAPAGGSAKVAARKPKAATR